jgi:hypothetical protein
MFGRKTSRDFDKLHRSTTTKKQEDLLLAAAAIIG